ncbi:O-antigen ligase family protein [Phocaeicola sp.]
MIDTTVNIVKEKGVTMAILAIAASLCIYLSLFFQYSMGIVFGLFPFILCYIFFSIYKPYTSLLILFVCNYFIMGTGRYFSFPIPTTNIYDLFFALIFTSIIIRQIYQEDKFQNIFNLYTLFSLLWLSYCIINLGNNITGEIQAEAWLKSIRPWAIYSFFTCLIISITAKHYTFIYYILIIWGFLTLLGAAKGYWQRNHGFDNGEWIWLLTRGGSTHLIRSGIRYFSFFTDAANFGCSMGLSAIVYLLSALYIKSKYLKIFFIIVGIAGIYGLLISGTRAAVAVPIAGLGLFIILAKKWKIGIVATIILIGGVGVLKYTTIGNSNNLVRRMRTAFNPDDASFQVRLNNQKALRTYMSEAPFGIGIGVNTGGYLSPQNKFHFASTCPPDSDLVNIWIQTGKVGLVVFLIIQFFIYLTGSYILLFRIKNPEIRGPLIGMLCGCAGMLVASYANNISIMFPNGPLIYTCLTLVFLGPYFDKQYTAEHGGKTT